MCRSIIEPSSLFEEYSELFEEYSELHSRCRVQDVDIALPFLHPCAPWSSSRLPDSRFPAAHGFRTRETPILRFYHRIVRGAKPRPCQTACNIAMTLPEMALRFILSNKLVSITIVGMRSVDHVRANNCPQRRSRIGPGSVTSTTQASVGTERQLPGPVECAPSL